MTRRRPRGRTWVVIGVVAVIVVAAGVVGGVRWFTAGPATPHARVGEVFSHYYVDTDELDFQPVDVALPYGELQVMVTPAADSIHLFDATDQVFEAPEGGSFVGVYAQLDPTQARSLVSLSDRPVPTPQLALRDGATSYPIPALDADLGLVNVVSGTPQAATVAVAGHPTSLLLDVTYDGVTQTVDLATGAVDQGAAAVLEDEPTHERTGPQPTTPTSSCGTQRTRPTPEPWTQRRDAPTCRLSAARHAYVGGLGWAPAGHAWEVVQVSGEIPSYLARLRPGSFRGFSGGWDARLDGARPVRLLAPEEVGAYDNPYAPAVAVFDVTTDADQAQQLVVTRTVLAVAAVGDHRVTHTYTTTWRHDLPPSPASSGGAGGAA